MVVVVVLLLRCFVLFGISEIFMSIEKETTWLVDAEDKLYVCFDLRCRR